MVWEGGGREAPPYPDEAAHRTIEGLRSKLGKAELIIDVQKKISSAFGIGIQDSEGP